MPPWQTAAVLLLTATTLGLSATNPPASKTKAPPPATAAAAKVVPAAKPKPEAVAAKPTSDAKAKRTPAERKAEAKALAAERRFQARLEEVTKAFGRYSPASRHRYPGRILDAVLLLDTVEDKERATALRRELFGEGTTADKVFGLYQDLLRGELQSALELHALVPQARWHEIAPMLRKGAEPRKGDEKIHDAAVMLHLLALCGPYYSSTRTKPSLKVVLGVRDELRERLSKLLRDAAQADKWKTLISRFRVSLAYALRGGKLGAPHWWRLLSDLTTGSAAQLELIRSLRYVKNKDLVADIVRRSTAAHPTHGRIATEAYTTLRRVGADMTAFDVMLDAEEQVPYPERRRVRLHYFTTLRYDHYRYRSGTKRNPVEGVMTFAEERTEREYAAVWPGDPEARMALGDVRATERKTQEATEAYRHVCLKAEDAALRWTAWLAWAEFDAQSAWSHRRLVEDVGKGGTNATVEAKTFLQLQCAVAAAAGGFDESLKWTREHLGSDGREEDAVVLVPLAAAMSWVGGDEAYALGLLKDADDASKEQTGNVILGLQRGQILPPGLMSSTLATAVTKGLSGDLEHCDLWSDTARLTLQEIPSYESAQSTVAAWQRVAKAFPKEANTAAQTLQVKLTDTCLAWVDKRPEDNAALKAVMYGAAYHLYRGYGHDVQQNTIPLFLACLERAATRKLPSAEVKSTVSYFNRGLQKAEPPEETLASCRSTIHRLYPDLAPAE